MTKNEGERMTKEQREIIETINNIPALLDGNKVSEEDSIKISIALVKAVQALKQPFEQIEWERDKEIDMRLPDDYVSRKDVMTALVLKGQHSTRYKVNETWELNYDEIREVLMELPGVIDPKPCTSEYREIYMKGWTEGRRKLVDAMEKEIAI